MKKLSRALRQLAQEKIVRPILKEIETGISAEQLARSVAIGITGGVFPVPGLTLLCSFFLQYIFNASFIVCQAINVLVTPAHFLSLKLFYGYGMMYILPHRYLVSSEELLQSIFESNLFTVFTTFFVYIFGAVSIWLIFAPVILCFSYIALRPISRFVMARLKRPVLPVEDGAIHPAGGGDVDKNV